jgi:hypothetical protein
MWWTIRARSNSTDSQFGDRGEGSGASGDLEVETMGAVDEEEVWKGTWVVTGGTDGLKGLEAHGTS